METKPPKNETDWMSWVVNGVFWAVLGPLMVPSGCSRLFNLRVDINWLGTSILGAMLIGAGIGSYFGEKYWWGKKRVVYPPESPRPPRLSSLLSAALMAGGLFLALFCLSRRH